MVWARPKSARHEHAVYKVKSILKGTEHEGMFLPATSLIEINPKDLFQCGRKTS